MNQKHSTRGVTAVEFAMVAPIVLLMVFAGLEFVRANNILNTIDNAAYVASRAVIVPGATKEEAIQEANAILALVGIKEADITFEPSEITEDTAFVSTNIAVDLNKNSWGISLFFRDAVATGQSKLRTERAPIVQAKSLPTILNPPPVVPPPEPPPEPPPTVPKPEPPSEPKPEPPPKPKPEPPPKPPKVLL